MGYRPVGSCNLRGTERDKQTTAQEIGDNETYGKKRDRREEDGRTETKETFAGHLSLCDLASTIANERETTEMKERDRKRRRETTRHAGVAR